MCGEDVEKIGCLTSETVQGAALTLEGVDNIEGGDWKMLVDDKRKE